jgi:hypothetical protein
MACRSFALVTAMVVTILYAPSARADTRRLAIVLGNNAGNPGRAPLRYAEVDAGKIARALNELGGVASDDMFLLQGKPLTAIADAFTQVKQHIAAARRDPGNRAMVLFYFSGHSDGTAIELGAQRLTFAELRRWLADTGADLRVVVIDSCRSGALLSIKGGHLGAPFRIHLADDLASRGEVLLTSTAADEVALESSEIGGSFFTHHLVSGLRGAADASGDGRVTLDEAYQYAYVHTLATTGDTDVNTQHPAYDYRVSGEGELVLTELAHPSAALELPAGIDRGLVIDLARDQVVAELGSDARSVIAVPPGRYAIRVWRAGALRTGHVTIAVHEQRKVDWNELVAGDTPDTRSKGEVDARRSRLAVVVAVGAQRGLDDEIGPVPSLRAELRMASGFSVAATLGSRSFRLGESFDGATGRESSGLANLGYHWERQSGRFTAWLGANAGVGLSMQAEAGGSSYHVWEVLGPDAGAMLRISERWSIALQGTVWTVFGSSGRTGDYFVPAGWLGAGVDL